MRLLLIRHGQTPGNVLGQLDTAHPGPGLTDLGLRQAAAISGALRSDPIDAIFVSTLLRTRLTAHPLAADRGLQLQVATGVHEIEAGSLEGLRDQASVRTYLETVMAWGTGNLDKRMPGAHDGHDFFRRFDADVAVAAAKADVAVVFSHGAAIRVWTAGRAGNVPPTFAREHELDNTGVVEFTGSPEEGWTLLSWAGLPVGGMALADLGAADPLGEPLD